MAEVEVARDGAVQTITLNRPDKLNAFTVGVHEELQAALEEAQDPAVRAVVITGAGRGFSAGQDLTAFGEAGDIAAMLRATYHVNVLAIRSLEKPVIAAVNGVCAGAGVNFVADADIVLLADSATLLDPHVSIGQVSAYETIGLVRKSPAEAIMRMALAGRYERIDAQRAYELGFVNRLCEPAALIETAMALAERITANAPLAVKASRQIVLDGMLAADDDAWRITNEAFAAVAASEDFAEGPRAFIEKRAPQWKGR